MTRKEKEIVRLQIIRAQKMTEAVIRHQYKDYEASIEAANEAGHICGRIAKVRREGVRKPSKVREMNFLWELDQKYGKCAELF